jgi:hypothetical protein
LTCGAQRPKGGNAIKQIILYSFYRLIWIKKRHFLCL